MRRQSIHERKGQLSSSSGYEIGLWWGIIRVAITVLVSTAVVHNGY